MAPDPVRRRRAALAGIVLALAGGAVLGCVSGELNPTAPPDDPIVVTFEVHDETFRVLLIDPEDIAVAQRLLDGEDAPSIPNGLVLRRSGVNEGWSWSLDPGDFEFADVTIEVCDGLPSDVEAGLVTSERYCPWSAVVVAIGPAT